MNMQRHRDDGLGVTRSTARQTEKLSHRIRQVFKDHGLTITLDASLSRVNFLDVTLDLELENYKPYRKPGDKPLYVSSWSNHPPRVLQNIPLGINKRLCEISSSKEVFLKAIPPYQTELEKCGYSQKLVWMEENTQKKAKRRSRRVIWFNPPHSMNVQTNVGREFLLLVDKHFPKGHPLNKILNRNTMKISYRCLPNMGRKLANHNSKILRDIVNPTLCPAASCNCQRSRKAECPVPGACNQDGAVYQATVSTNDGRIEKYVGLAKNFKKRFRKHRTTIKNKHADGQTTLSNYVHLQRDQQKDPVVSWNFMEKNVPDFNPISGLCKLCTREKFQIVLNPSEATLNHRAEILAHCRHKEFYLIGDPPD